MQAIRLPVLPTMFALRAPVARPSAARSVQSGVASRVQVRSDRIHGALVWRGANRRIAPCLQRVVPRAAKTEEVEAATNGAAASNGHASANMMQFDELSDIIR